MNASLQNDEGSQAECLEGGLFDREQKLESGVFVASDTGIIIEWNHIMAALTGIPETLAIQKPVWELHVSFHLYSNQGMMISVPHRDMAESYRKMFGKLVAAQDGSQFDVWYKDTEAKKHILQIKLIPIHLQQQRYWCGIAQEITTERELVQTLHAGEMTIAHGEMASQIAHEINNPLAGLKSGLLLLAHSIPQSFQYYDYLERMLREVDRISKIVRQLYGLYQVNSAGNCSVLLSDLVMDVCALLESRARQGRVKLVVSEWKTPEQVVLNEDSLRQALYNIIRNAIEAAPADSQVEISVGDDWPYFTIAVKDHGEGISPAQEGNIFKPFYSTKKGQTDSGLGLGLSVSKNLIEKMQGSIRFESNSGVSTTFFIHLPVINQGGSR